MSKAACLLNIIIINIIIIIIFITCIYSVLYIHEVQKLSNSNLQNLHSLENKKIVNTNKIIIIPGMFIVL